MKKSGSEPANLPAEPLERARLQAEVAKQRVRIAKDELKRARKGLKEAKREAKRARKQSAAARKAWKRVRRAQKKSVPAPARKSRGKTTLASSRHPGVRRPAPARLTSKVRGRRGARPRHAAPARSRRPQGRAKRATVVVVPVKRTSRVRAAAAAVRPKAVATATVTPPAEPSSPPAESPGDFGLPGTERAA
jgi:hypothetical protein